ncbi:MAG: hypothetical protein HY300_11885, partial [Verrucomicrobia bacterium]|nr:hypothetical protein [Verrucomicrobiota bacterium]
MNVRSESALTIALALLLAGGWFFYLKDRDAIANLRAANQSLQAERFKERDQIKTNERRIAQQALQIESLRKLVNDLPTVRRDAEQARSNKQALDQLRAEHQKLSSAV